MTHEKATIYGRVQGVFFDRDGTLIENIDYLSDPNLVNPLEGVKEALGKLRKAGVLLFLFTNQSGIGRGYFSLEAAEACNRETERRIGLDPGFDGICIAPERPDEPPMYRKPSPKFILETITERNLDPNSVWMIGDKQSDFDAGRNAGVHASRIISSAGEKGALNAPGQFRGVPEFVDWLIRGGLL